MVSPPASRACGPRENISPFSAPEEWGRKNAFPPLGGQEERKESENRGGFWDALRVEGVLVGGLSRRNHLIGHALSGWRHASSAQAAFFCPQYRCHTYFLSARLSEMSKAAKAAAARTPPPPLLPSHSSSSHSLFAGRAITRRRNGPAEKTLQAVHNGEAEARGNERCSAFSATTATTTRMRTRTCGFGLPAPPNSSLLRDPSLSFGIHLLNGSRASSSSSRRRRRGPPARSRGR